MEEEGWGARQINFASGSSNSLPHRGDNLERGSSPSAAVHFAHMGWTAHLARNREKAPKLRNLILEFRAGMPLH